jgi:putative endonuclease
MSTQKGRIAEAEACNWLSRHGYTILNQNWRTRYCEIDIVAYKNTQIFFIEVKFRQSNKFGDGIDYIDAKKQRQLQFAAELYMSKLAQKYSYRICAIGIDGRGKISDFIEITY